MEGYGDQDRRRLGISISSSGLQGWLADRSRPEDSPRLLTGVLKKENFDAPRDSAALLSDIENTVYDNPELLDDYRADVVITAPDFLLAPAEIADDDLNASSMYSQIFSSVDNQSIFIDSALPGVSLIHCLTPGLRAFLGRTLPGADVKSHMSVLLKKWSEMPVRPQRICVNVRQRFVDIAAFREDKLLGASVKRYDEPMDALYHIMHMAAACEFYVESTEFMISADRCRATAIIDLLREHNAGVVEAPFGSSSPDSLPGAVALTITS